MDRSERTVAEICTMLAECEKWLLECPFPDGQPYCEVASDELAGMAEWAEERAIETNARPEVLEAIRKVARGESTVDTEVHEAWLAVAKLAEQ